MMQLWATARQNATIAWRQKMQTPAAGNGIVIIHCIHDIASKAVAR
jgi:hypothetical protein